MCRDLCVKEDDEDEKGRRGRTTRTDDDDEGVVVGVVVVVVTAAAAAAVVVRCLWKYDPCEIGRVCRRRKSMHHRSAPLMTRPFRCSISEYRYQSGSRD